MISRVDLKLLEVALSRSDGLNPLDLRSGRSVNYASQRRASYPQTRHESLDPISADRACVTKQCKGTYKQFVVFQSSFQHCFHLKFHLSTLAGTSPLRGWTKLGLGDRPTPGGAYWKLEFSARRPDRPKPFTESPPQPQAHNKH